MKKNIMLSRPNAELMNFAFAQERHGFILSGYLLNLSGEILAKRMQRSEEGRGFEKNKTEAEAVVLSELTK